MFRCLSSSHHGISPHLSFQSPLRYPPPYTSLSSRCRIPPSSLLSVSVHSCPYVDCRLRSYLEAGLDTIEKISRWNPEEMRLMLRECIKRTGFTGSAPLSKEAATTVETARHLPRRVAYRRIDTLTLTLPQSIPAPTGQGDAGPEHPGGPLLME